MALLALASVSVVVLILLAKSKNRANRALFLVIWLVNALAEMGVSLHA